MPALPRSTTPLFIGSAFLMFAGGVNGLILPLRGSIEGFSSFSLGLLGTGWAIGFVLGCLLVPNTVQRVGHIRAFSAMTALAVVSILGSLIALHPAAWIPLRGVAGFCFAGAAMIVESWLNERSEANVRGRVFGIYTMVNLAAVTAGQMVITLGDSNAPLFFVVAAIFYSFALLPTSLYTSEQPQPLTETKLDLATLWKNSPVAVAAVILIGVSNSAFGTLGAVYGEQIGLSVPAIALFMSVSILAGAAAQVPIGYYSDKMDRRIVLVAVVAIAALCDAYFVFWQPQSAIAVLIASSLFGACIFAMYPVIVAHANDHAPDNYFLRTSSGLLLLFGCGSIAGPLMAGGVMSFTGPSGLFITTAIAHVLLIVYAIYRITQRAPVPVEQRSDFVNMSPTRMQTTETIAMDPRVDEEEREAQSAQ
ncbi:MFS transporter [Ahrensia marina]|uniref:MFS transporter n=1 Tax=Ahrensia marina TaxID=1514904 RepID=A0A0M9GPF2_9HYPH|nr:MFS transporter [Ahrensia marina]KPB02299.1 MFS transporter [Ahrensia marina]